MLLVQMSHKSALSVCGVNCGGKRSEDLTARGLLSPENRPPKGQAPCFKSCCISNTLALLRWHSQWRLQGGEGALPHFFASKPTAHTPDQSTRVAIHSFVRMVPPKKRPSVFPMILSPSIFP